MTLFETAMTVINTIAIIVIPIVAAKIGQDLQVKGQKRKDKLDIFKILMMNRVGWSYESVRALNIIDIVFADEEDVCTKWSTYYNLLCIQKPDDMQKKQISEAQDKLLEAMAKALGYKDKITWDKIQNPYIPQGMISAMQQQANIQAGQEKLAAIVDFITKFATQNSEQQYVSNEGKPHTDVDVNQEK